MCRFQISTMALERQLELNRCTETAAHHKNTQGHSLSVRELKKPAQQATASLSLSSISLLLRSRTARRRWEGSKKRSPPASQLTRPGEANKQSGQARKNTS
jgi:hypothetical protein